MQGDALHLGLRSLLLVEVQYKWLVVYLIEEGVLIFEGSSQGVSLEGPIFLCDFHDSLAIFDYLGDAR